VTSRWFQQQPERFVEAENIIPVWDMAIATAKKIKVNCPEYLYLSSY
jgi:hypothetical protein